MHSTNSVSKITFNVFLGISASEFFFLIYTWFNDIREQLESVLYNNFQNPHKCILLILLLKWISLETKTWKSFNQVILSYRRSRSADDNLYLCIICSNERSVCKHGQIWDSNTPHYNVTSSTYGLPSIRWEEWTWRIRSTGTLYINVSDLASSSGYLSLGSMLIVLLLTLFCQLMYKCFLKKLLYQ